MADGLKEKLEREAYCRGARIFHLKRYFDPACPECQERMELARRVARAVVEWDAELADEIAKEVGGAFAETHMLNRGLNRFREELRAHAEKELGAVSEVKP